MEEDGEIELKDSEPFAYLLSNNEEGVKFRYKPSGNQDLHINLISPLKSLVLDVYHGDSRESSLQGYITIKKGELKEEEIEIGVLKTE